MTKSEALRAPAQWWSALAGTFLLVLGVLSLVISTPHWGTVTSGNPGPDFLIWRVSGWLTVLWMATGALGLVAMARAGGARGWSLFSGALFAAMAIWGFIDGLNVASIFAAGTADNITHAVLGALGLAVALLPEGRQAETGMPAAEAHRDHRFTRANGALTERERAAVGPRR